MSDPVQPLSYGKYSYISQQEFDLSSLSLTFQDDLLQLIFPSGEKRPLTEKAFESLCRVVQVPLGFAKRLKDDHNAEVLTYLQKQLSAAYLKEPAIVVCDSSDFRDTSGHVLSVTTKEAILPSLHTVCEMDKAIINAQGNLKVRLEGDDAYLRYGFITKKAKPQADDSEYEFGHVFAYSLHGYEPPQLYQVAVRCDDMSVITMPFKPAFYPAGSPTFMGDVVSTVENLDAAGWLDFDAYLQKLKGSQASLREVKETKQRLVKSLKIDKEDRETETRMEEFFGWKKLVDKYEIRSLTPKPSKRWLMSAASHLNLLDIFKKLIAEATHAPSDLPYEKRQRLEKYATRMLAKMPDLAEKDPPKVIF